MTPSYAVKNGVRYRYYISSALIQGQPDKAAKVNRVPATEIEALISNALRKRLAGQIIRIYARSEPRPARGSS